MTDIKKYRKKPVVIEALEWTGNNVEDVLRWIGEHTNNFADLPDDGLIVGGAGVGHIPALGKLQIPTLEGTLTASAGDFIIRGVKGEFYACKPDIFEMTYEEVPND